MEGMDHACGRGNDCKVEAADVGCLACCALVEIDWFCMAVSHLLVMRNDGPLARCGGEQDAEGDE